MTAVSRTKVKMDHAQISALSSSRTVQVFLYDYKWEPVLNRKQGGNLIKTSVSIWSGSTKFNVRLKAENRIAEIGVTAVIQLLASR